MAEKPKSKSFLNKAKQFVNNATVEPLMFIDGLTYSIMIVFVEDLQMRRICEVSLQQNETICDNLRDHHEVSNQVQLEFSVFAFYDGIIKSAIPLFFILFMGAWSDKYGRKVPMYTVQIGHFLNFLGFLLFSLAKDLPVEFMLLPTFLDSLGGGNVCFLTAVNAYISDITGESSRTSRVGLANSIYFLGGPIGTFVGKFIYEYGGYTAIFSIPLAMNTFGLIYLTFYINESHGPYASKLVKNTNQKQKLSLRESLAALYGFEHKKHQVQDANGDEITLGKMIRDFFNPRRIIESFKCTLKKREGNTRCLILLVISCSLLRRLTRSPYVFAFSRHVLLWEAGDYSLWVTFKNLMATVGSLVAVPLLSGHLHVSDYMLGMIGALSSMFEYLSYGIVVFIGEFFFWIAPIFAVLINSCTIAQRAMLSKFVSSDELGKVSAVLGALDGIMPMTNFAIFMAVYRQTVTTFPAAHFFLAAACSALMVLVFFVISLFDKTRQYDVESGKVPPPVGPIISKTFLVRSDSRWLSTDYVAMSIITTSLFEEHLKENMAGNALEGEEGKPRALSKVFRLCNNIIPPVLELSKLSGKDNEAFDGNGAIILKACSESSEVISVIGSTVGSESVEESPEGSETNETEVETISNASKFEEIQLRNEKGHLTQILSKDSV